MFGETAAWKAEAGRAAVEIQALRLENEALRLQMEEKVTEAAALGILTASEYENKAKQLKAENEALRKRLENATEFVFHRRAKKSMEFNGAIRLRIHSDGKWGICYLTEGSMFSVFPDGKNLFDTLEEAESAARKAMEVHG